MEALVLLSLALAPVAFVFTFVYLRDKFDREPLRLMILNFVMGIVIAVPVIVLEVQLGKWIKGLDLSLLGSTLLLSFVGIALAEEGFKFLALMIFGYSRKSFNEPYDGIMYSVAVSLGFAGIENVLYVYEGGWEIGLLRAFTSVPGHAMMGVLMGYFVGMAKFKDASGPKVWYLLLGLLAATVVHGAYDFFLLYDEVMVFPLAFVVLIVGIILGLRAMKLHRKISPHQPKEGTSGQ